MKKKRFRSKKKQKQKNSCQKSKVHHTNKECLKYAHENGCPWNEETCHYAAKKGSPQRKSVWNARTKTGVLWVTWVTFGYFRVLRNTSVSNRTSVRNIRLKLEFPIRKKIGKFWSTKKFRKPTRNFWKPENQPEIFENPKPEKIIFENPEP